MSIRNDLLLGGGEQVSQIDFEFVLKGLQLVFRRPHRENRIRHTIGIRRRLILDGSKCVLPRAHAVERGLKILRVLIQ